MKLSEYEHMAKSKLSKRELNVSKDAWKRLSAQLEDGQQEKKSAKKLVYGIAAASIVGILLLSSIFTRSLKTANSSFDSEKVVGTEQESDSVGAIFESNRQQEVVKIEKTKAQDVLEMEKAISIEMKIEQKEIASRTDVAEVSKQEEDTLKEDVFLAIGRPIAKEDSQFIADTLITKKVIELIAKVSELESTHSSLTDAEIDTLLQQAQRELLTQKYTTSYQSIDATALLLDVEAELDQTFKEQVFDALKTSFQKVRTAMGR